MVNGLSCSMVCKRVFCAEFPDITDNAGKTTRRIRKRRRTQAIAKRFSFHSNAVKGEKEHLTFEKKTFNIRRGGGVGGGGVCQKYFEVKTA